MLSLPQFHKSPPHANCGTCTLCCDVAGVSALGKPFYSRCQHLHGGCTYYQHRPEQCRAYRCAWHLNLLGERTDRRPDECGVVFQFEPDAGKWYLAIYEAVPGAASADKARYLAGIILNHKNVRHLSFGNPPLRIVPFGSDIPIDFAVAPEYPGYTPPAGPPAVKIEGNASIFVGSQRDLLMPKVKEQRAPAPIRSESDSRVA